MNIIIRSAQTKDVKQCHRIESVSFSAEEAASLERITLRQREFPQGFLVAEHNGKIIGMINSGASDQADLADEEFKALIGHDRNGSQRVIFSLAVDPAQQGEGIGARLMQDYIDRARSDSVKEIRLICKEQMIDFYKRFGFENCGRSVSKHGGVEWWEMLYTVP